MFGLIKSFSYFLKAKAKQRVEPGSQLSALSPQPSLLFAHVIHYCGTQPRVSFLKSPKQWDAVRLEHLRFSSTVKVTELLRDPY